MQNCAHALVRETMPSARQKRLRIYSYKEKPTCSMTSVPLPRLQNGRKGKTRAGRSIFWPIIAQLTATIRHRRYARPAILRVPWGGGKSILCLFVGRHRLRALALYPICAFATGRTKGHRSKYVCSPDRIYLRWWRPTGSEARATNAAMQQASGSLSLSRCGARVGLHPAAVTLPPNMLGSACRPLPANQATPCRRRFHHARTE